MARTIQILAIGDIHLKIEALQLIILSALNSGEKYDLIICSGDFSGDNAFHNLEQNSTEQSLYNYSIEAIFKSLSIFGIPVLFVPGNHDLPNISGNKMCHSVDILSGFKPFNFNGINFIGIGGSPTTPGSFSYEWTEEEAIRKLSENDIFSSNDIWILHSPPFGTKIDQGGPGGGHLGSTVMRELIEQHQPRLCLCGHIHEGMGVVNIRNSIIINLGSIFDVRHLNLNGNKFPAFVSTYFSIIINQKSTTICASMFCTSASVNIEPLIWHCDEKGVREIKNTKSLFSDGNSGLR